MEIEDIVQDMTVKTVATLTNGFNPEIPAESMGIVERTARDDDVYVVFELSNGRTSKPVLCHPVFLAPAD